MSNQKPTIKVSALPCLITTIVCIGIPCLAIWHFGLPSILLTAFTCIMGVFFYYSLPSPLVWRVKGQRLYFDIARSILFAALCLGGLFTIIYINYLKP